jgi:alpha-beta hydrolase superfamily lysophospholipase
MGYKSVNLHQVYRPRGNEKGLVIVVHGLAEHQGRYTSFANFLFDNGFSSLTYDLRGHGQSGGKRGKVRKFKDMIEDLHRLVASKKLEGRKIFLLGHSLGALIVDLYPLFYQDVSGVIASGGPTDFLASVKQFLKIGFFLFRPIGIKVSFGEDLSYDPAVAESYISDPLVLDKFYVSLAGEMFIKGVKYLKRNISNFKTPILLLHGEDDKIVPSSFSKSFINTISIDDKTLIIYPHAKHEIINEVKKDQVYSDIINWLDKHI